MLVIPAAFNGSTALTLIVYFSTNGVLISDTLVKCDEYGMLTCHIQLDHSWYETALWSLYGIVALYAFYLACSIRVSISIF